LRQQEISKDGVGKKKDPRARVLPGGLICS
jgi:hypothetical protein